MSPVTLGGIAAAAGGLLLVGVGVAAGRWQARRDWANHRDYTALLERLLARRDLERAHHQARIIYLQESVVEALRIIQDLTDQRLPDAEPFPAQVVVPPDVWRALQEARENPEAN